MVLVRIFLLRGFMLSRLANILGKTISDADVIQLEQDFGEKLEVSMNQEDAICKITLLVDSRIAKELLDEILTSLEQEKTKESINKVLGVPTYSLNFPDPSKKEIMFFYDKTQFWLVFKFKENHIESIFIMPPSIIPEVIKTGRSPMRICRS